MTYESPTVTAHRLGLIWDRNSGATLTNDKLLDLAVAGYWKRRGRANKTPVGAATAGEAGVAPAGDAA